MLMLQDHAIRLVASDILANGSFSVEIACFGKSGQESARIRLAAYNPDQLVDLGRDIVHAMEMLEQYASETPLLSPSETQQGGYANGLTSKDAA